MRIHGDLHIHSRFSRATSAKLMPSYLDRWSRIKGIGLLGTGDCTHPGWLEILRSELEEAENGFYILKKKVRETFDNGPALEEALPLPAGQDFPRFVLTGEISTIYKKGDKTRKVHHLVILPDFKAAAAFQIKLEQTGNIRSDGRPILGIDSRDLLGLLLETDDRCILIPAHIWTPWFSALGAKSGFDSIQECYRDLTSFIPAIETGLSSNPPMNWALESLDQFSIISNSDAHSPEKLGREATIFEMDMNYESFKNSFSSGIAGTVEFFPQEGKYHYEGHRACKVCLNPEEAAGRGSICPVCGKPFTPGVMSRVLELADRPVDEREVWSAETASSANGRSNHRPYYSLIPLREILSEILGTGPASKKVEAAYKMLIETTGSEFSILMDLPLEKIEKPDVQRNAAQDSAGSLFSFNVLAEAVGRMRRGDVFISPGYDGEYGVIRAFAPGESKQDETGFFEDDVFRSTSGTKKGKNFVAEKQAKYSAVRKTAAGKPQPSRAEPAFVPDMHQKKAIDSRARECLIVAGPGTGKTAVLAEKIAALVREGADPASVLALSFTVKAAGELRERVLHLTGEQVPAEMVLFRGAGPRAELTVLTFHSLCACVLRDHYSAAGLPGDFRICGENERKDLLEEICRTRSKPAVSARNLGDYIEGQKRFLLLPGEKTGDLIRVLPLHLRSLLNDFIAGKQKFPGKNWNQESVLVLDALYAEYRSLLRSRKLVDYEGLITGTARLFSLKEEILLLYRQKYRYIFVDEYQDLNFAQYVLVRLLAPGSQDSPSLWVIGDPNQAIYGFRGSDKAFIDRFLIDYPNAAKNELRKSFRCSGPIIKAAGLLVHTDLEGMDALNKSSVAAAVSLFRREYPTEKSEAEGIARIIASLVGGTSFFALDSGITGGEEGCSPENCAVLVRAAALAEPVIKALKDHGIPHEVPETASWWEEDPVKTILDFLEENTNGAGNNGKEVLLNVDDDPEKIILKAWKSLDEKGMFPKQKKNTVPETVSRLVYLAKIFGNIRSLLDGLSFGSGIPGSGLSHGVKVMTIHASKGLEFDHVFVPALEEGILPFTLYDEDQDIDEERRLLYVAMTRARYGLWLSCASSRFYRGRILKAPPSRFLTELGNFVPLLEEAKHYKKDAQMNLF